MLNPQRTSLATDTVVAISILVACSACSTSPPSGGFDSAFEPKDDPTVVVENHTWWDLTVYLERDEVHFRLGSVGSQETGRFDLRPLGAATSYRLVADPSGSSEVMYSDPVFRTPNGVVHWILGAQGRMSRLTVR